MMAIGEIIRTAREEKNLNQSQLAAKAGISQATVNYLETGKRNPGFTTIVKIAKVLDLNLEDLTESMN